MHGRGQRWRKRAGNGSPPPKKHKKMSFRHFHTLYRPQSPGSRVTWSTSSAAAAAAAALGVPAGSVTASALLLAAGSATSTAITRLAVQTVQRAPSSGELTQPSLHPVSVSMALQVAVWFGDAGPSVQLLERFGVNVKGTRTHPPAPVPAPGRICIVSVAWHT